eukprot:gene7529-678_t
MAPKRKSASGAGFSPDQVLTASTGGSSPYRMWCTHCNTAKTPQWREGPLGPKTLCNACGVRWQRSGKLDAPVMAKQLGGSGPDTHKRARKASRASGAAASSAPPGGCEYLPNPYLDMGEADHAVSSHAVELHSNEDGVRDHAAALDLLSFASARLAAEQEQASPEDCPHPRAQVSASWVSDVEVPWAVKQAILAVSAERDVRQVQRLEERLMIAQQSLYACTAARDVVLKSLSELKEVKQQAWKHGSLCLPHVQSEIAELDAAYGTCLGKFVSELAEQLTHQP